MRKVLGSIALLALALGCRTSREVPPPGDEPKPESAPRASAPARSTKGGSLAPTRIPDIGTTNATTGQPVVLPASGRIHMVNLGLRFVVIDYTLGGMPSMGSVLPVFRNNEKVAQVRLSGPEPRNGFVTADIVEGFIQVDDEVRVH